MICKAIKIWDLKDAYQLKTMDCCLVSKDSKFDYDSINTKWIVYDSISDS